ncbi:MAG: T9SS type A sorting domain-containing protein [Bacteroidetes bacterium]|nr:T9SS type A sorting domain-containing protein [Bacteroidota bacterium]HET6243775.1 T9SS type A sorting domain-containing protein [Bacteroidia bacterium]
MNLKKIISGAGLILTTVFAYSQISEKGIPLSISNSTQLDARNIETIILPSLNNKELLKKDSINAREASKGYTFAVPIKIDYRINNSGSWETLPDGSKIWRLQLTSIGSYSGFLIFDTFYLPTGSKLYAYSGDKKQILGAFTEINNKANKRFSIGPIVGESIIIEYNEPPNVNSTPELSLSAFIHSYKDVFTRNHIIDGYGDGTFGTSEDCHINVRCPEGNNWCNQRRSVALIALIDDNSDHLLALCTGSLITNERRDLRPYFLTANHCVEGTTDAGFTINDWVYIFNYQSQDCSVPSTPPPTTFSISGSIIRSKRSNSDFALIELNDRPPGNFNTYFNGFDNSDDRPNSGVGIHHPNGDIKKISFYEKKLDRTKYLQTWFLNGVSGTKAWRVEWESGVTARGSSGSPIYDASGRVIGQLWGGWSFCGDDSDEPDYYGRFAASWDEGSSSTSRLRDWLSPNSTSNLWISAMGGDEPCRVSWNFSNTNDLHTSANVNAITNPSNAGTRTYNGVYEATTTIEAANNVTVQTGTSVTFNAPIVRLGPGFRAVAGSNFRATTQGCLRGCGNGRSSGGEEDYDNPLTVFSTGTPTENSEVTTNSDSKKTDEGNSIILNDMFSIYPNPNSGIFTVTIPQHNSKLIDIYVLDALGKVVFQKIQTNEFNISININSYSKGMYFIKISDGENVRMSKIIYQ